MDYACPIKYNAEYRQVETQGKAERTTGSDTEDSAGILNWMTEVRFLAGMVFIFAFATTYDMTVLTHTNWVSVYWVIL
jgi:hypothetical protein